MCNKFVPVLIVMCSLYLGSVVSQCDIAETCVTDLSDQDCASIGQHLVTGSSIFGCCPSCQIEPGPEVPCNPPANCLADGTYAPVQCKGDLFTGRCFCSDTNGNRIFGQMWQDQASGMTCGCSRRRAELEASGSKTVTLHCTPFGDYEPLQCDQGLCWCVDQKTGQPTESPVLEENMKILPCYNTIQYGEQYLRRCESEVIALALIYKEQSEHGTNFLGNPVTFCDYDGSYGPYQITNGIAYCTGRDSAILGAWSIMADEMQDMNCNCARDTMIYFPERGMSVTEVCLANGNYKANQTVGSVSYCVDDDGYPLPSGTTC